MKTDRYGISGSTLKIIAAISMVLDHVSRIVLTNLDYRLYPNTSHIHPYMYG